MTALVRIAAALPAVAVLLACVALVGLLVSRGSSAARARAVVSALLVGLAGLLTALFCLVGAYAWLDGNAYVLELADTFAVVAALGLAGSLLYRRHLRRAGLLPEDDRSRRTPAELLASLLDALKGAGR